MMRQCLPKLELILAAAIFRFAHEIAWRPESPGAQFDPLSISEQSTVLLAAVAAKISLRSSKLLEILPTVLFRFVGETA